MQTSKIIQAVILMLIIALAASCAAGKQFSEKVFGPRPHGSKETTTKQVRFLGAEEPEDSLSSPDLTKQVTTSDSAAVVMNRNRKVVPDTLSPVVRSGNTGGVRTKRTRDDQ